MLKSVVGQYNHCLGGGHGGGGSINKALDLKKKKMVYTLSTLR